MNLAEELALVAIDPSSGRHALGMRSELNACLAGLLITELLLDGVVEIGDKGDRVVVTGKAEPKSPILAAATAVVIERGPKIKAILSHMDKGLSHLLGLGTWDAVVKSLADVGVLAATHGAVRPRNDVLQPFVRDATVAALRVAAAGQATLDTRDRRTAVDDRSCTPIGGRRSRPCDASSRAPTHRHRPRRNATGTNRPECSPRDL